MTDLYDILGIEHDADAATIRKAFRRRARTVHPDHGGGAEDFRKLVEAHDILSDPERRARYDGTGETGGESDNAIEQKARALISNAIGALIQADNSPDLAMVDAVALIRSLLQKPLDEQRAQIARGRANMDRAESKAKRLQGRFKRRSEGKNLMEQLLRGHLSMIANAREALRRAEDDLKPQILALELLASYDFEREAERVWVQPGNAGQDGYWQTTNSGNPFSGGYRFFP